MVNYPNRAKRVVSVRPKATKQTNYGNRGMTLERILNATNIDYRIKGRAVIHKKPTPIKIVKVDYQRGKRIVEAYFETPSTTDYNGIYRGKYLDFEAKETTSKTSFPFSNVHDHQIDHIESIIAQGGIGFFIVLFSALDRFFLIDGSIFCKRYRDGQNGGKKSISLKEFEEEGHEIKNRLILNYLDVVDRVYFEEQMV